MKSYLKLKKRLKKSSKNNRDSIKEPGTQNIHQQKDQTANDILFYVLD